MSFTDSRETYSGLGLAAELELPLFEVYSIDDPEHVGDHVGQTTEPCEEVPVSDLSTEVSTPPGTTSRSEGGQGALSLIAALTPVDIYQAIDFSPNFAKIMQYFIREEMRV